MGIAIVPFVATLAGVTNAFARIMWGAVSDRFGREYTMAFAFALEGVLIFLMTQISGARSVHDPDALVFLAWARSMRCSAITGDVFGPKNASATTASCTRPRGSLPSWPGGAQLRWPQCMRAPSRCRTTSRPYSTSPQRSWPFCPEAIIRKRIAGKHSSGVKTRFLLAAPLMAAAALWPALGKAWSRPKRSNSSCRQASKAVPIRWRGSCRASSSSTT